MVNGLHAAGLLGLQHNLCVLPSVHIPLYMSL
jgi:hypothetical protein